jgi:hypothetical protein
VTGPLEIVGAGEAPVCEDAVSEVVAAMADQGYTTVRGSKVHDVSASRPGAGFGDDEDAQSR